MSENIYYGNSDIMIQVYKISNKLWKTLKCEEEYRTYEERLQEQLNLFSKKIYSTEEVELNKRYSHSSGEITNNYIERNQKYYNIALIITQDGLLSIRDHVDYHCKYFRNEEHEVLESNITYQYFTY